MYAPYQISFRKISSFIVIYRSVASGADEKKASQAIILE